MVLRRQRRFPYPSDQGPETFGAFHLGAQNEGVDENADEAFDLGAHAVCYRHSDQNVTLVGVAKEQRLEGRKQRYKQCHPLTLTEGLHSPGNVLRQIEEVNPALVTLN